jgi:hypothetical protein
MGFIFHAIHRVCVYDEPLYFEQIYKVALAYMHRRACIQMYE